MLSVSGRLAKRMGLPFIILLISVLIIDSVIILELFVYLPMNSVIIELLTSEESD